MGRPVAPRTVDLGAGIGACFTDRHGGVSLPPYDELNLGYHVGDDWDRAHANRELLARAVGAEPRRCCYVHQVHGDTVVTVAASQVGTVKTRGGRRDGDAMVTAVPGAPLVILVADCVPVLLADPVARVVAAVHAGRRGVLADVLTRTVEAMQALGAASLRAAIGPAICAGCYEVDQAMADDAAAALPATAGATRDGTPSIDLVAGLREQLRRAGVTDVTVDGRCTVESPELFSYRRDGVTGRFAGVVWMQP